LIVTVLPGFEETLAIDFLPKTLFINDDFPTLDLPEKQISGKSDSPN
jgi:hypothetical protein